MNSHGARALAEGAGTFFLLAVVVGSGIMGERLGGGNAYSALLVNSLATSLGLYALIVAFGPFSGAHFNPVVTLGFAFRGRIPWHEAGSYVVAQFAGAALGVVAANTMYDLPLVHDFVTPRTGPAQWLSESVATLGLLIVVFRGEASRTLAAPSAVAAYITAAYWFTSSTSFANPAVTLARSLTGTFAGIRLEDVLPFVAAQLLGMGVALAGERVFGRPDA